MCALRSNNHCPNTISILINSAIEHHTPSRTRLWPFVERRLITIFHFQIQNLLIREVVLNRLIIFNWMMCQMVSQDTTFDSFLSSILDVILR